MHKNVFVSFVEADDFIRETIAGLIQRYGYEDCCEVVSAEDSAMGHVEYLSGNLRVGSVLDRIERVLDLSQTAGDRILAIGPYNMDIVQNTLSIRDNEVTDNIRLTEKEVALLVLLKEQGGIPISRDVILKQVWKYAQDVETHTLETHIYRLRQKIEKDPYNPEILMTQEEGYYLAD